MFYESLPFSKVKRNHRCFSSLPRDECFAELSAVARQQTFKADELALTTAVVSAVVTLCALGLVSFVCSLRVSVRSWS